MALSRSNIEAIERGVDSGRCRGLEAPCPYHVKSDESKYWYRSRLLKLQRPDWDTSRIMLEIEKQKTGHLR